MPGHRHRRSPGPRLLAALALLLLLAPLFVYGIVQPAVWTTATIVTGTANGVTLQPPFGPLSRVSALTVDLHHLGAHLYLLGSDQAGRDLVALAARGSLSSLPLVAAVVLVHLLVGVLAGAAMAMGAAPVRALSRALGRWTVGLPYLALAILIIEVAAPADRLLAFVLGMAAVGWRDVAELVAERIEHVRAQPFALGAAAMGTGRIRFLQLHVAPFLRPALLTELAFQCSAVLVLLAELGFLQVFLGGSVALLGGSCGCVPVSVLVRQPELGQILSGARDDMLYGYYAPVLVPALWLAALALLFDLAGQALRSHQAGDPGRSG